MDTSALKRLTFRYLRPRRASDARRAILTYHSVAGGPLSVPLEQFEAQMRWLVAEARVVTLDQLLGSVGSPGLRVAITFDDGYATVYERAAPTMKALGLVGTVFVTAGWMGAEERRPSDPGKGHYPGERFMTWSDVRALHGEGWTIGSHGVEHDDLTTIPAMRAYEELVRSRALISGRIPVPCLHFAYTWGSNDERVRRLVMQAGYASAASTAHGAVTERSDRFALPRLDVRREYTLADFGAVVRGEWDYLGGFQRVRTVARAMRLGSGRAS